MVEHLNVKSHENPEYLQGYVEAVLGDTPDEAWGQAARHRLQGVLESKKKESWMMSMFKNGHSGKVRWAVAVAAIIIVIILSGMIPKVGGTGLAFGQVVQRIQQIQTLFYQTVSTPPPGTDQKTFTTRWFYKAPHLTRQEWMPGGSVEIVNTRVSKLMKYYPQTKTYYSEENVSSGYPVNRLDRIAEINAGTIEILPEKELAGHQVAGFRAPLPGVPSTAMVTIWADVQTGNPVQVEFRHADGGIGIWSDFQYNVPLDDALFNLTPPEGYTFQAE